MKLKKTPFINQWLFIILAAFLIFISPLHRFAYAAQLSEQDVKLAEIDEERQIENDEEVVEEEEGEEVGEIETAEQKQASALKNVAAMRIPGKRTDEIPPKKAIELPSKKQAERPAKKLLDKFEFNYAALEGYDRNMKLNSTHKSSLFTDQYLSVGYLDHFKKFMAYRFFYRLRRMDNYKFGDENLMNHDFQAQSSIKLIPGLYLEPEYKFSISRKPHEPVADYDKNEVKVGMKHFLYKDILFHKPSYIFIRRDYQKFSARLPFDVDIPSGRHRRDDVNALDYEIGVHPMKNMLFQIHNQVGRSDSNDQFFDFYDYTYYQVTPVLTWQVTQKIFLVLGYQFQRNNYDDRAIHGRAEAEDISTAFGSIFYQLNRYASLGFHAVYVHNDSNVPELEYDDSIFSIGLHLHA